jgi:hypothetical protein
LGFPCQLYSTGAPLLGKMKKLIIFLFIFITGLHNMPSRCGASVASAAGPFLKKKTRKNQNALELMIDSERMRSSPVFFFRGIVYYGHYEK